MASKNDAEKKAKEAAAQADEAKEVQAPLQGDVPAGTGAVGAVGDGSGGFSAQDFQPGGGLPGPRRDGSTAPDGTDIEALNEAADQMGRLPADAERERAARDEATKADSERLAEQAAASDAKR